MRQRLANAIASTDYLNLPKRGKPGPKASTLRERQMQSYTAWRKKANHPIERHCTFEWFITMTITCRTCNRECPARIGSQQSFSFDRTDSRGIYTPPNVETMCGMCNSIFSNNGKAEAVAHIQRVAAHMEANPYA
jgi:hypothetical protein